MPILVALYPGSRTLNAGGLCHTPGLFPLCCFCFSPKNRSLTFSLSQKTQGASLFSILTQPRRDNASHGALWNGYNTIRCMRRNAAGLAVHTLPSLYIVLPDRTRRLCRSIRRMTVSAQYAQYTDVGRPFAAPHRTRPRRTPATRPPLSSRSCNLTIALTDGILDVAHRGRNAIPRICARASLHAFSPTTRRPRATEIAACP
ncbi:hypothetical protein B0H14DRAFT_1061189 [Mycena olivaceomarginata]|nr:hypothetical protein B0H14DRAFT_1061189 [Mycena olivaceomarginata]